VAEPAHALLRQRDAGGKTAGRVDACVDHARATRQRVHGDPELVGARSTFVGQRPRALVHMKVDHPPSPENGFGETGPPSPKNGFGETGPPSPENGVGGTGPPPRKDRFGGTGRSAVTASKNCSARRYATAAAGATRPAFVPARLEGSQATRSNNSAVARATNAPLPATTTKRG